MSLSSDALLNFYTTLDPQLSAIYVPTSEGPLPALIGYNGMVVLPCFDFMEYYAPSENALKEFAAWCVSKGYGYAIEHQPYESEGSEHTRTLRYLPTAGGWEAYMARFDGKRRNKMRKYLSDDAFTFEMVDGFDWGLHTTLASFYNLKFQDTCDTLSDGGSYARVLAYMEAHRVVTGVLRIDGAICGLVEATVDNGLATLLFQSSDESVSGAGSIVVARALHALLDGPYSAHTVSYMSDEVDEDGSAWLPWKVSIWKFDEKKLYTRFHALTSTDWAGVHAALSKVKFQGECATCGECCSSVVAGAPGVGSPDPLPGEDADFLKGQGLCPCVGGKGNYPALCRMFPFRVDVKDGMLQVLRVVEQEDFDYARKCPVKDAHLKTLIPDLLPAFRKLVRLYGARPYDDEEVRLLYSEPL